MRTIIDLPMSANTSTRPTVYLVSTFIVVNILFFIDEGYYDLRWMADFGNWVAFAIYFSVLFLAQFGLDRLLNSARIKGKVAMSIVFGSVGGLLFLLFGIFG